MGGVWGLCAAWMMDVLDAGFWVRGWGWGGGKEFCEGGWKDGGRMDEWNRGGFDGLYVVR